VVRVLRGRDGRESRIEGKTRTPPARLRRALELRDQGCRFPGCGSRYTEAHHIQHWADGGATRFENLILLCKTHHRLLHEGGFRLKANPDRLDRPIFVSPRGIPIPDVAPRISIDGMIGSVPGRSAQGNALASSARWERDVSVALYLRAMESLM
jgi:hypothetical protein